MCCRALAMLSNRPGNCLSHARSMSPTCLRCKFSWLPHSVQGMMGNCRWSDQRTMSFSAT